MSPRLSIAQLNDVLRTTFLTGRVILTQGVAALPEAIRAEIIDRVRSFDTFTEANDPFGEHDFGAFDHPDAGRINWKIDYYDRSMQYGSDDPADPAKTCRVLTILLGEEW
jgi:hypothetical protein